MSNVLNLRQTGEGASSRMGFHVGGALLRVASVYPTVLEAVLEQVQNAIDANAKTISVVLNKKTRHIAIRDDGDGVSDAVFEETLQRVCSSGKEHGKLGRFGIGLISPLDKCDWFTFTSCPKGVVSGYREWKFVTDDIRSQDMDVTVPLRKRPDLFFIGKKGVTGPKGTTSVIWRTEVNIFRYSADKMIARITTIDSLTDAILDRFSTAMRKQKVVLNLKFVNEDDKEERRDGVTAKLYTGKPLGEMTIDGQGAGRVTFRMFLAPKTTKGQKGKVLVGEADNDYRFGFNLFARSAEGLLSEEVSAAMLSGIFEGEIVGEKVRLRSTRRAFEVDDALVDFCSTIEVWFQKHGSKHLDADKEASRDERYQELGIESLRQIEDLLKLPQFSDIRSVLGGFRLGNIGDGHTAPTDKEIAGEQKEPSVATQGQSSKGTEGESRPDSADNSSEANPSHQPYTVAGPRGKQRTLVKRGSKGLQLSMIAMDGSDKLWELDARQGILHFNTNHPIFVACDPFHGGTNRKLKQLFETVTVFALMTEAMPDEFKETIRYTFDVTMAPLTHLFHASTAFNLRKQAASAKL